MDNRNVRPAGSGQPGSRPPAGQPPRRPASPGQRPAAGQPQRRPATTGQQRPAAAREPQRDQKEKRTSSRWFRAILMVLATLAVCLFLAIFILQSASDLFGLNQEDQQIEVTIPENATISQIASLLNKAGVVDQQLTFQLYASLKKDEKYHGGNYIFNSNMGYDEILVFLRTGNNIKEVVKLTFVEGKTLYEIAMQLEESEVCDAEAFMKHLDENDFTYAFMDQLPDTALRYHRLEGYIFPDTYEFYVGENVDSVCRKFLSNFNNKMTTSLQNRMRDLNLTLDQTITLASIIQKEAGGVGGIEEMKRVSSVFHNRLNLPEVYPKLQSDVTKHYVNNFIKPFLDLTNQEMYDAYNTYECDGLPVAPICNPGIDAIEAALNPYDTNYYFFVTDVQEHFYYAETAQEHYANVNAASKVEGEGRMHGTDTE